jgi:hypothetical protein
MNRRRTSVVMERMERSSCHGKKDYMSLREAADRAAASRYHTGEDIQAYQCPFCLLFHIGHRPDKKRLQVLERISRRIFDPLAKNTGTFRLVRLTVTKTVGLGGLA